MSKRSRKPVKAKKAHVEKRLKKGDGSLLSWFSRLRGSNQKKSKAVDGSDKLHAVSGYKPGKRSKPSHLRTRRYIQDFFSKSPHKSKARNFIWWLNPKQQFKFWFSKNGILISLKLVSLGVVSLSLLFGLVYAYYSKDLRGKDLRNLSFIESTKFYDRTGETLLYSIYGDENRTVIDFDEISKYAKWAVISIEDKNFYEHHGLSITGIIRASVDNALGRRGFRSGGSTITQQYVKNALLSNEKSYERKLKEAILSLEMERLYTKDEILGFYLNEIPYGGTAYGIEAAARSFFNKPASKLTIEESAMLAAIPQRPTYYSPYGENADELVVRTSLIIDLMKEQGYISEEEANKAKEVDLLAKVNTNFKAYRNIKAPYLVLEAQRRLEEEHGASLVATSGWKIITTVDLDLQKKAEKAVKDNMAIIDRAGGNNAALVATDPKTGQVLAAVGGRDFDNPKFGRFNGAFTAKRQPGSSVKPYTYATLMKDNYGAGSVFYDLRTDFGGNPPYIPGNADNLFRGALTVRQALAQSRNIPAVKALYITGIGNVMDTWRDVGLVSSDLDPRRHGLSFALGSAEVKLAEHVNGYETFANGGIHHEQTLWLKITDQRGQVVEEWVESDGERVFDQQIAYIIANILSDESSSGPLWPGSLSGYNDIPGTPVAVKTGTTNSRRDAWMMGFSTKLTAGVWVGHTQNNRMSIVTPYLVGPIFDQFMTDAHNGKGKAGDSFDKLKPSGLKTLRIDRYTGRAPVANSSTVSDLFPSWYKLPGSENVERFTIDTVSGKLATNCTPESAKKEVSVGGIDAEIPPDDLAYPRWSPPVKAYASRIGKQPGIGVKPAESDDVHSCNDKKPKVGDITYSDGLISANIEQGKFSIKQVDFKLDGSTVLSDNSHPYQYTPSSSLEGKHNVTVVVTDDGLYQDSKNVTIDFDIGGVTITSPSNGSGFNHPSLVSVAWEGDESPYRVEWSCDGGSGSKSGSSSPFSPSIGDWSDFDGECQVTVIGNNGSGSSDNVSFEVG